VAVVEAFVLRLFLASLILSDYRMMNISNQHKRLFITMTAVYVAAFFVIMAIMGIAHFMHIRLYVLLDDPSTTFKYPPYGGLISNLGILVWVATGAICLFTAIIANPQTKQDRKWRYFLAISGLLSIWLGIDDLWMVHENVLSWFNLDGVSTHIPRLRMQELFEMIFFGCYALGIGAYIYYFRRVFKQTAIVALAAAFLCFALSIVIDIGGEIFGIWGHHIPEETFKLLGIVGWLFYFSWTSYQFLQRQRFAAVRETISPQTSDFVNSELAPHPQASFNEE
jgi:hypothetical protein